MISIKRFIERDGEEHLAATLASYRSALNAMGESGVQACPPVGFPLRQNLLQLQAALAAESPPSLLQEVGQKVEAELTQWGCGAADYFKQRATEAKELMLVLARTAELTGERDQRYSRQFQEFTGRLRSMADLHDLALIRGSLLKSAIELRTCAETMAQESQKSLARLREDMGVYQARLDDAERLAGQDPLTGLDNRRRVESSIEFRMGRQKAFSVLLLDLNGFKQLNDSCGHLAGDEILKQFSAELKSGFRATDVVGRLGGDEFIVVLDGGLQDANAQAERISRWVFGDYTIRLGDTSRKVPVSAAIGTAEWQAGDSPRTLLDRADAAMYRAKRAGAKPTEGEASGGHGTEPRPPGSGPGRQTR
jgi:diguanylate cyclase (GGDEF)-like protein